MGADLVTLGLTRPAGGGKIPGAAVDRPCGPQVELRAGPDGLTDRLACESAAGALFLRRREAKGEAVPRLATIGRVGICVYADDHMPPHFHILTPDGDAQVRIDSLEIIRGSLRRSDFDTGLRWAHDAANRERLWAEWSRLNERD
jgi:hypothetical protein